MIFGELILVLKSNSCFEEVLIEMSIEAPTRGKSSDSMGTSAVGLSRANIHPVAGASRAQIHSLIITYSDSALPEL